MINASGDKERRFGLTDAVAGVYPASFVVCYEECNRRTAPAVGGCSLAHPFVA